MKLIVAEEKQRRGPFPPPFAGSKHSELRSSVVVVQALQSQIHRARAQFLFDAQQLVVLGNTSVRLTEPVLICPTPVATAKSAMNVSSVSPERCDITDV